MGGFFNFFMNVGFAQTRTRLRFERPQGLERCLKSKISRVPLVWLDMRSGEFLLRITVMTPPTLSLKSQSRNL